jgi:hypothetical protein
VNVGKAVFWVNSSLDSLFQKIPVIAYKKRPVKPGDAFENNAQMPGLGQILNQIVES